MMQDFSRSLVSISFHSSPCSAIIIDCSSRRIKNYAVTGGSLAFFHQDGIRPHRI
jgi:hypothetical protein